MFDEEVDKFETYEDYLDSLVSEEDHKYLEDEEMARTIAELGYRYRQFLEHQKQVKVCVNLPLWPP